MIVLAPDIPMGLVLKGGGEGGEWARVFDYTKLVGVFVVQQPAARPLKKEDCVRGNVCRDYARRKPMNTCR